jgi:hypothetical protein
MVIPDRDTAQSIILHVDGLLTDSHALPGGLTAALRAYRAELMRGCAGEAWARPGHRTRYGRLADAIGRHIADGTWQPGDRMPSAFYLAKTYYEQGKTVDRSLFVLAVRGHLTHELLTYYVLAPMLSLGRSIKRSFLRAKVRFYCV